MTKPTEITDRELAQTLTTRQRRLIAPRVWGPGGLEARMGTETPPPPTYEQGIKEGATAVCKRILSLPGWRRRLVLWLIGV